MLDICPQFIISPLQWYYTCCPTFCCWCCCKVCCCCCSCCCCKTCSCCFLISSCFLLEQKRIKRNFKKKLLVQVDQRVTTIHWTDNSTGPFQNYIIPFVCPPKFCITLFPFSPGSYNGSKRKKNIAYVFNIISPINTLLSIYLSSSSACLCISSAKSLCLSRSAASSASLRSLSSSSL